MAKKSAQELLEEFMSRSFTGKDGKTYYQTPNGVVNDPTTLNSYKLLKSRADAEARRRAEEAKKKAQEGQGDGAGGSGGSGGFARGGAIRTSASHFDNDLSTLRHSRRGGSY